MTYKTTIKSGIPLFQNIHGLAFRVICNNTANMCRPARSACSECESAVWYSGAV
jgi:hypothetical protein